MKKLFYFATPFMMAVALFFSCTAQTPKASYKAPLDSLSYAVGLMQTSGIEQFFAQRGIDSAHIKDVLAGIIEGINVNPDDKAASARAEGYQIGRNIAASDIHQMSAYFLGDDSTQLLNENNVRAGFIDGVAGKASWIDPATARLYVDSVSKILKAAALEKTAGPAKEENRKWLEENKSKDGVVALPSGLQYKVIKEGKGKKPVATDRVKVDYVGTLIDGTEFDSSIKRGQPAEFPLNGVIKGWTEGLQLMPVGSEYEFYIPYDLAYGPEGNANIPHFATLIFKVTLHEIVTK